ncbi:hypothetical protein E2C01_024557 [Portunus trituberculatus]|uniref:Uncharacterized protein n=1 Tax=Portunus trituberculatus TaxID=210409 RepID=A0A5B7EAW7_PORTR|nr:hypothetical protein [Portunus trituberculatus]
MRRGSKWPATDSCMRRDGNQAPPPRSSRKGKEEGWQMK